MHFVNWQCYFNLDILWLFSQSPPSYCKKRKRKKKVDFWSFMCHISLKINQVYEINEMKQMHSCMKCMKWYTLSSFAFQWCRKHSFYTLKGFWVTRKRYIILCSLYLHKNKDVIWRRLFFWMWCSQLNLVEFQRISYIFRAGFQASSYPCIKGLLYLV